jgi:acyl-CoA synthetase (NDP forming)
LIGPNCNGLYSPAAKLVSLPGCLITGGVTTESGTLSVVSQSGSFNDFLCQMLTRKNIRFNKTVSTGNECDLHAEDFLEYYGNDSKTTLIAGYLEGIKDGRRFYELAKEISKKKPIIIWKGGMTEAGARSAIAHTGALAGSSVIWETMFKQAGIINPISFEEVVDCILAFSWTSIPKGRKIAILSSMGGTNIGTTDNCIRSGLEMAKLTDVTRERLNVLLPGAGTSASNPLDVGVGAIMNPKIFAEGMRIISEDENVDMVMVVADPDAPLSINTLIEAVPTIKKPVVVSLFDMLDMTETFYRKFLEKRIPIYHEPKRAVAALAKMCDYADYVKQYKS